MSFNETELQIRLRRSKESLTCSQFSENEARKALADAVKSSKQAKERYEELFLAEEQAEVSRRKTTLSL